MPMRDYAKVAPTFWTDQNGKNWKVPQIKGRLKCGKIPSHAALRAFVIHRAGGICQICGHAPAVVADHIVSRRNGGSHHPDNLQAACESCNAKKAGLVDAKCRRAIHGAV